MSENETGELQQVSLTAEDIALLAKAKQEAQKNIEPITEATDDPTADDIDVDEGLDESNMADSFDFSGNNEIVDEILEEEDKEAVDPASLIEQPIVRVEEDDAEDDEFSYLFDDNATEPAKAETEPVEKGQVEETLEGETPKYLQAGTKEYFSAVKSYAERKVQEQLGLDEYGEPVEYDAFDNDHIVMFNHFASEARQIATEEKATLETKTKAEQAFKKASAEVDNILENETLAAKYVELCDNLKVKDKRKLDEAVAKGDYSGYIKLAKRVKGTMGKVAKIKQRNSKTKVETEPDTSLDDSMRFMGY